MAEYTNCLLITFKEGLFEQAGYRKTEKKDNYTVWINMNFPSGMGRKMRVHNSIKDGDEATLFIQSQFRCKDMPEEVFLLVRPKTNLEGFLQGGCSKLDPLGNNKRLLVSRLVEMAVIEQ